MNHILTFSILILFMSSQGFAGQGSNYLVKVGDTLSQIAADHLGRPVYPSSSGSLERLLKLNPQLNKYSVILPGQTLRLDIENYVEVYEDEAKRLPAQQSASIAEALTVDAVQTTESVEVASAPIAAPEPLVAAAPVVLVPTANENPEHRDFWFWAGMGVNYTSMSQNVPGIADVNFGRIKGPSVMARGGFWFSDNIGVDLNYKSTPGEAKSSSTIKVNNGAYDWTTLSVEGLWHNSRLFVGQPEFIWRVGFQQHQMPFLIPQGSSELNMTESSLTTFSLGFEYRKQLRKKLRVETMLRYQQPIAGSNELAGDYRISPKLSFDGSVGAAYEITDHMYMGVYWYGQQHDFQTKYTNPLGTTYESNQNLFFTNFDLRLGLEF